MASKPETKICNAIVRLIKRRGYWVRKIHGNAFQRAGIPDIDAVVRGRSVRIEVKQPGEQPTPLQKRCMQELEAAGAFVTVATSSEEAEEFIEYVLATVPE